MGTPIEKVRATRSGVTKLDRERRRAGRPARAGERHAWPLHSFQSWTWRPPKESKWERFEVTRTRLLTLAIAAI
jgi:hypothetical protein